jgi:hypothetical protein
MASPTLSPQLPCRSPSVTAERQSTHPSRPEHRKHQRVPTDDPAVIKLIYPVISGPLTARVLDVSKEGLRVRLSVRLQPGTTVQIQMERVIVFAEVRYCLQVEWSFEAGVQIQDVFPKHGSSEQSVAI